jgi:tetratricopeptide (TPR) repeat protein
MRSAIKVLLLFVLYTILSNNGLVYSSAGSQRPSERTTSSTLAGPPEIHRYWLRRKALISGGKTIIGRKELEEIHRVQLDKGIRNLPTVALLLVREGLVLAGRGRYQEAVAVCEAAKTLAPQLPCGFFGLARVYWSHSKLRLDRVAVEYLKGAVAFMKNFKLSFIKVADFFFLVGQSILLCFLFYSFILFLKYFPSFVEGVMRNFRAQVSQIIRAMVKIIAILLPFLLQLDFLWAFLYWSLLVMVFLGKRERFMLCLFFLLIIYIPWAMDVFSDFLNHSANTPLNIYTANEETWNREMKDDLVRHLEANPGDSVILFTLGLINKREGKYSKAEEYFKGVVSKNPSAAEAMTNLANVYLATGNIDRAIELNKKAIDVNPRRASFHFNLHRANSKKSTSVVKTDPSLQKATELNPTLIHNRLKIESDNMNRFVIDEPIPAVTLWMDVAYRFFGKWVDLKGLVSIWFKPLNARWSFISPLFFLGVLIAFWIFGKRKGSMRKCPLCGSSSRRVFPRRIEGDFICLGCYRLFVKKEGLNPRIKVKKVAQVKGYRQREELISRILSLFSLGGGHVWRNCTVKGVIFLLILSLFILRMVHWHGVIRNPEICSVFSPLSSKAFLIGLFAFFYFLSLRSISRFERRRRALDKISIPSLR